MSLLKVTGRNGSPLKRLVTDLSTIMKEGGSDFTSPAYTEQVCSLESLSPSELENLNTAAQSISETLKSSFEVLADNIGQELGFESLSAAQLEAGTMIALAAGNPVEYATKALTQRAEASNGVRVIAAESAGSAGSLDYRDNHALEAFDERELSRMIPYSIAFNVQASRQDEFSETFYPTTIVSPENGGIDISCNWITVFNGHKHTNAKTTDFNQRKLIEAVADHTVLADESTALVPFVRESGEDNDKFIDDTLVAPYFRNVAGVDVKTAPLKVGSKINLIGISSHPELLGMGIMDHTDAVDARISLDKVYMKDSDGKVLRFNVSRLPRNEFHKSVEGMDREMSLNFHTETLILDPATKAVDGSDPLSLQAIRDANYRVRLGLTVNGHAHVEFGTVQVYAAPVSVVEIQDEDFNPISLTQGAGLAIVQTLEQMTMVGYELGAARTNTNKRTRGLLINSNNMAERFHIPLGAPLSAPSPIGSNRDTTDLENLIVAARIRNSNNAVTTLLNYADTLRSYVLNRRNQYATPEIEGVGRHMIVPFYEEMDLDLSKVINSITSKDRAEDISSVLINAIRDIVYRMYRNSAYQAALDASSMGGKKPTLLVGTDCIIQRHLMISGENRTFGIAFEDAKIVTALDSRMDNKIILTFTRGGGDSGRPDPLSFGTHAWMPELTSSIMINRDGATYQEAMVQPRNRHINNLPIMAVINVHGLTDVMTTKIGLAVDPAEEDNSGTPAP